ELCESGPLSGDASGGRSSFERRSPRCGATRCLHIGSCRLETTERDGQTHQPDKDRREEDQFHTDRASLVSATHRPSRKRSAGDSATPLTVRGKPGINCWTRPDTTPRVTSADRDACTSAGDAIDGDKRVTN